MTKSKIIRLMNELLEKYGDVEVAYIYDYYKSRLINENGTYPKNEDCIVRTIKISEVVDNVTNTGEYKQIVEIVEGKRRKPMQPVVIKESKEKYETEEQKKARDKHRSDFNSMINHMCGGIPFYNPYENVKQYEDIAKLTDHNPSPKEFGMAMDNYKKRH